MELRIPAYSRTTCSTSWKLADESGSPTTVRINCTFSCRFRLHDIIPCKTAFVCMFEFRRVIYEITIFSIHSYAIMKSCWAARPSERPEFSAIRQQLALQLEEITDEYSYLRLDAQKDYYNVADRERLEQVRKKVYIRTSMRSL